ncbi:MAG: hypothetical protein A3K19_33180 [Lentisphaerae bacterium RIFOXYB12_FULL_65_16]|nr:MAG: hypothetical protein A3K18_02320 [Lentisphaerae bacterium RIFOXYA12_64_32]OGV86990.1 MAG: hypothetical protein A3K19_33180 [Lentisphaerae bacterium RIFOXYB12_FULL_65_16]
METLRVLVVDDETGMRTGVQRVLKNFNIRILELGEDVRFEVAEVENGAQALARISELPPHLLLLDHRLPDMTGTEILEKLGHTEESEMLVIVITAYASIETALAAAKRGAYDFLAKPFTPDELKATVRKAATRLVLQRRARMLAEEKRQVRFQFISVLAHELKAPLAAIDGYLHILKDRTLGAELPAYDRIVDRSLVRLDGMRKLIFDLLDMTRIESGQKVRHFERVDVCSVAREIMETLAIEAKDRNITMELDSPVSVDMTADRSEIQIVLSNLLSNAVKYNRDGGGVKVTVQRAGDRVRIVVTDTGIGMTADEVGRLFQDFTRIRNAKTKHILGSGLGLSTTRKIAELYGGTMTVESQPDVGSTFTAVLQAEPKAPMRDAAGKAAPGG